MRLQNGSSTSAEEDIKKKVEWILKIGNGSHAEKLWDCKMIHQHHLKKILKKKIEWILKIGDGKMSEPNDGKMSEPNDGFISVPKEVNLMNGVTFQILQKWLHISDILHASHSKL